MNTPQQGFSPPWRKTPRRPADDVGNATPAEPAGAFWGWLRPLLMLISSQGCGGPGLPTEVVVDVVLHNGVADLWGTVSKTEQAKALRVLVESTPGVKRVEHYLTCHGELLSVTEV